jgi:ATP-dependent RNA circularization protein (DNA/RNA ligase family)
MFITLQDMSEAFVIVVRYDNTSRTVESVVQKALLESYGLKHMDYTIMWPETYAEEYKYALDTVTSLMQEEGIDWRYHDADRMILHTTKMQGGVQYAMNRAVRLVQVSREKAEELRHVFASGDREGASIITEDSENGIN